jgi:hypothetical protein
MSRHILYVHGVQRIEVHTLRSQDERKCCWRHYVMFRTGENVPCFSVSTKGQEPCVVDDYTDIVKRPHGYYRPHCRTDVMLLHEDLDVTRDDAAASIEFAEPGIFVTVFSDIDDRAPDLVWVMEEAAS